MRRSLLLRSAQLAIVTMAAIGENPARADDPRSDKLEVRGHVLGPDGKPKAGARVGVLPIEDNAGTKVQATSDAQGRFHFTIVKSSLQDPSDVEESWRRAVLVASAQGCGPDWIEAAQLSAGGEWTPRLVADDVPIEGTVADLGGTPLAGVKIHFDSLHASGDGTLDGFLKSLRDHPFHIIERHLLPKTLWGVPGVPAEVKTDDQGRFRITGLGRERLARLEVEGPNIEKLSIYVLTRRDANLKVLSNLSPAHRVYMEAGANLPVIYPGRFHHLAGPSRPIVGTVRDRATKAPIPGMGVTIYAPGRESFVHVKADEQGRYRIEGLPAAGRLRALAFPLKDEPYLKATHELTLTATDLKPVTFDFDLARGVLVRGRLTDTSNGRAVQGTVTYLAYSDNPFLKGVPEIGGDGPFVETQQDGTYILVALPGPGVLAARAGDDRFTMARPEQWGRPTGAEGMYLTAQMGLVACNFFHKVVKIEPQKDATSLKMDIGLDPGQAIRGSLVDPEGKPVAGVSVTHRTALGFTDNLVDASFEVTGLESDRPRQVWFYHAKRNLGRMLSLPGSDPGPLTVALQPCGSFLGRALDANGMPRPNVRVSVSVDAKPHGTHHQDARTDSDGRFRITGLRAGVSYVLEMQDATARVNGLLVRSGETRDLGDLRPDTKTVK